MFKSFVTDDVTSDGRESFLTQEGLARIHVAAHKYEMVLRAIDLITAVLALAFFAPLMISIALLARISSDGPVLFRHVRLGRGGQTFTCYKFRTMYVDAEQRLDELLLRCERSSSEWQDVQKLRADPRVIPFGRILRKLSLDELPQLFNVVRGDMSIVGPRPIVPEEAGRYGRHIRAYEAVKPGITGLWQISGRNLTTYRRRVACDVLYVRSRCVRTNMRILAKTVPVILTARGAY